MSIPIRTIQITSIHSDSIAQYLVLSLGEWDLTLMFGCMNGYIAALLAAVSWGSCTVPLKKFPAISPWAFQVWMSLGVLISSAALSMVNGHFVWNGWAVVSGLYWTSGAVLSLLAIRAEGMAEASSRWMGLSLLVSFILGIALYHEPLHLGLGLAGLVLLLVGLLVLAPPGKSMAKSWRSLGAGLIFGTYLIPLRLSGLPALEFVWPMSLGIATGAIGIALIHRKNLSTVPLAALCLGAGVLWNVANVCSILAIEALGFAIGFPLTQLSLLVSMAWGVVVFGEAPSTRERWRLAICALLIVTGAGTLGLAKSFF